MMRLRIHILAVVLTAAASSWCAMPGEPDTMRTPKGPFTFFPDERIFPRLLADGTAHTMGLAKDLHTRRWLGSIGALRPIIEWTAGSSITLQTGIGASVQTSIVKKPGLLEVVTVDFFVDVPIDIRISSAVRLRTGYGHYSAHLADDGIEILGLQSVNYTKDYFLLLGMYMLPAIGGHVYGGGRIDYASLPERDKHWTGQFGLEAGNIQLSDDLHLYAALDVKVRSEVAGRTTQSFQVGAKLFPRPLGVLRIACTYRTGIDDRGQFYRHDARLSLLGIYLDF